MKDKSPFETWKDIHGFGEDYPVKYVGITIIVLFIFLVVLVIICPDVNK